MRFMKFVIGPNHQEVNLRITRKLGTFGKSFSIGKKITRGVADEVCSPHIDRIKRKKRNEKKN